MIHLFVKDPHLSSAEPIVVVGAASKGIIKRDQQNNAVVYKSYYAQNPFAHVDNSELEKYKREVEQNQMREQGMIDIVRNRSEIIDILLFNVKHERKMLYLTKFETVSMNNNNSHKLELTS